MVFMAPSVNYIKTDLIDLVEIDQESSSRYLPVSIDGGVGRTRRGSRIITSARWARARRS